MALFLLLTIGGFTFLSKNHYLCGDSEGQITRDKENQAKSLNKYPNSKSFRIDSRCGYPDGKPSASVKFFTNDEKSKIEQYYPNHYINYDPPDSINQYKWWNVEINF